MPEAFRYLKPEDIRRIRNFEFAAKAMVEGYLAGRHRSRHRGSSIEFHEFRPYSPGDDPALIDWRVFARSDRYYLKTFEQEINMECHLLLDSSASMGFKHGAALSKLEFASFFAACLAWLVVHRNDRVSLHTFDTDLRTSLPAGGTRRHLHNILHALEENRPGRATSLSVALQRCRRLLRRKGTLVILSDFFDEPTDIFHALNPWLHRGFRIHLFQILDPAELDLPGQALARFADMETGRHLTLHPPTVREAWKTALGEHIRVLRRMAVSRNVDHALAVTDTSYHSLFDRLAE